MKHEFTIKYSRAILSRAYFKFWRKNYAFDIVLSLALLTVASYWFFVREVTEWYVVFFFTVALIFTIAVYSLYFVWRKQAIAILNSMKVPETQWKLTDESLYVESDAGKVELPWTAIKKIWRFKEVWLLFYANGAFSTLPIESLGTETLGFIKNRVIESGGKIWKSS